MPTLEAIHMKIKKLQAQAEAIAIREATHALDRIRDIVEKHGLSIADIEAHLNGRKGRVKSVKGTGNKSVKVNGSKGKLPPKYRDPKTGATWSGRARPPAWIANVRDRSKFLIADVAEDAVVAAQSKSAGRKPVAKTVKARKTVAAKKVAAKKATVKKTAARKTSGAKTAVKGASARKVAAKTAASGKTITAPGKRTVAVKKASVKAAEVPKAEIAEATA
ncbi:histidine biosynthesis protein [Burkholderia sp. WAC0059]|uniref:H-NS histone family protein n=1 Tax=Burkholderia sp. WAC0059 TaxID=2066022 RepID=UPI000C7F62FE|nr:H-NS histone family protein [Burkholderia sp. WAC0059]PLZ02459.1 histidine biosynthesis protein [Burkholderia sp. WAC0059]